MIFLRKFVQMRHRQLFGARALFKTRFPSFKCILTSISSRMPPKKAQTRRIVSLDSLFGHTLLNITGEPVTPTKIAIFQLIRTLFHAHFGVGAVPSLKPFDKDEKTRFFGIKMLKMKNKIWFFRVFTVLYGLIIMKSEISYDDFRCIVRILNDGLGRSIYYRFVTRFSRIIFQNSEFFQHKKRDFRNFQHGKARAR